MVLGMVAAGWTGAGAATARAAEARPANVSPKGAAAARGELTELRERIEALQKKLAGAEELKSEAADALQGSERAISDANRRLFEIASEKKTVSADLARLSTEARAAEARVKEHQARLGRLIYRRYTAGDPDALRLALSGDNPADAARLLHYYGYLQRAYVAAIDALRAELATLASLAGEQKEKVAALAALETEAGGERSKLQAERVKQQAVLAQASKQIDASRRQITTLRRDEDRLTKLVEQITRVLAEREQARAQQAAARAAAAARARAAREAARARGGAPKPEPEPAAEAPLRSERVPEADLPPGGTFASTKGRLALPVTGNIANRFGQARADSGLQWRGINILARSGAEVRAVAPGRVVFADWLRGFGNLMIVDHGDGYMSLYGNNESLLRRVGDGVRGGDPVATVGASGGSEQPGLYFELRHQGRPFDPLGWAGIRGP